MIYDSVDGAITALKRARMYAPYKYSGKWFIAQIGVLAYAFRTKKPLISRARKIGLESINIIQIGE